MHTNRLELYLKILLGHGLKSHNINMSVEEFFNYGDFAKQQRYEKQLLNELEIHIQGFKQEPLLGAKIEKIVRSHFHKGLKKGESMFFEKIKSNINKYFFKECEGMLVEDFIFGLWTSWFLEFFTDVFVLANRQKHELTYTTHEILNKNVNRFVSFCIFFDEDFALQSVEEKILQKINLKILQKLVEEGLVSKKLTYEYDKDIKSINVYIFEARIRMKCNLYSFKINLVKLALFVNKSTPYSRGLTYLNINKIMLVNSSSAKEFNLKDLNFLYKLFATEYVIDVHHYWAVYEEVVKETPTILTEEPLNLNIWGKINNAGIYWYNLIYLNMKDELEWLETGFFWNYMLDFRGRLYVDSIISYQSARVFRNIYGYKNLIDVNVQESIIIKIDEYIENIKTKTMLMAEYPRLDTNKYKKEIFWLFIEIAKIFKGSYLKHDKYSLSTQELLEIAIANYDSSLEMLDFEKRLELMFIRSIFYRLNKGVKFNFIIFKDSTASALQLLTLVLNVNDKELTKIFNLNSKDAWYDPYTYIISLFLQKKNIKDEYYRYFTRKFLKKTIMTYNYSATLYTCMQNFYEEIKIKNLPTKEKKLITEYFVAFYRFLEELFNGKNFFEKSLNDLNTRLLKNLEEKNALMIYLNDESTAFLQYYTQKERRINIIDSQGSRLTTLFWNPTEFVDIKKTSNALKPNTIHALDAALVRLTIYTSECTIATIHDSFGAPLYDIEGTINLVNKNLNLIYYKAQGVEWYTDRQYYSIYTIF